jgi:Flp pilus assembly protein CpaB
MQRWSVVVVLVLALLVGAMALRNGLTNQVDVAQKPVPPTPWTTGQDTVLVAHVSLPVPDAAWQKPVPPTPWQKPVPPTPWAQ